MTRRSLTRRERQDMWVAQGGRCKNCDRDITLQAADAEHYVPVWMGNGDKPDALWCGPCHAGKTATDQGKIAKVKRLLGITRSQAAGTNKWRGRLKGRGFQGSRKFNGDVVWK